MAVQLICPYDWCYYETKSSSGVPFGVYEIWNTNTGRMLHCVKKSLDANKATWTNQQNCRHNRESMEACAAYDCHIENERHLRLLQKKHSPRTREERAAYNGLTYPVTTSTTATATMWPMYS